MTVRDFDPKTDGSKPLSVACEGTYYRTVNPLELKTNQWPNAVLDKSGRFPKLQDVQEEIPKITLIVSQRHAEFNTDELIAKIRSVTEGKCEVSFVVLDSVPDTFRVPTNLAMLTNGAWPQQVDKSRLNEVMRLIATEPISDYAIPKIFNGAYERTKRSAKGQSSYGPRRGRNK